MRKTPLVLAAALTAVTAGCYRDFDFTSDSKADYTVVDAAGTWTDLASSGVVRTGTAADWPVPSDWDGNGFWDPAVVTPTGSWITSSPLGTITYAPPAELPAYDSHWSLTILPVPADYDGDGTTDPAWYRESDATWWIEGQGSVQFGVGPSALPGAGTAITENDYDFPVPADYDGDGKDDLSVFNPSTRSWRVKQSSNAAVTNVVMAGNVANPAPVPADYDGVGHAQRAVYGPDGWVIEGHGTADPFGSFIEDVSENGIPAVADYNGDGAVDLSYVDPGGTWHTKGSVATFTVETWMGAWPVPTGYNLRVNKDRIFQVGFCTLNPDACTGGEG